MIIAGPSSTKSAEGVQSLEMRQTKRGDQWRFPVMARVVRNERRGFWACAHDDSAQRSGRGGDEIRSFTWGCLAEQTGRARQFL